MRLLHEKKLSNSNFYPEQRGLSAIVKMNMKQRDICIGDWFIRCIYELYIVSLSNEYIYSFW